MVLSVLYVWCQLNRNVIVNFWFGTQFKAMYLPWVLFAFNLIISGGYVLNKFADLFLCFNFTTIQVHFDCCSGILELVGILIGHLYFFLTFQLPQEMGGPTFLSTPQFL